jgi:type III secretion protein N (ATPase)
LGQAGHYPAIDIAASLSRVFPRVTSAGHQAQAARVRGWMAKYADIEFLLQIGEYKPGGDPLADVAIAKRPAIEALLRQGPHERVALPDAFAALAETAA